VGAHLSGGVDSSTIVSIATKILKNELHTFSSAFDLGKEYDERAEIDLMQKTFKTNHHQISISSEDVLENLDKIIWHLDEPVIGPAILPMYKISQLVKRKGIVVVNGGQGVDEMFGGYKPYFALAVKNFKDAIGKNNFSLSELFYAAIYLNKGGAFTRFKDKLVKKNNDFVINWLKIADASAYRISEVEKLRSEMRDVGEFERSSYVHLKYYLPGLLQQEDRLSMASSIESRVPLIDNRIIDLSMQIPSWHKIKSGSSKAIFREAMRGIVPDEILNNKIKRGYPTPISVWFAGPLHAWAQQFLSESDWYIDQLVDRNELQKLLELQKKNPTLSLSHALWKAIVTEKWFRLHFGPIIK
jgi:asparagine synthase (glutamine-hydrolysing)